MPDQGLSCGWRHLEQAGRRRSFFLEGHWVSQSIRQSIRGEGDVASFFPQTAIPQFTTNAVDNAMPVDMLFVASSDIFPTGGAT